MVTRRKVRGRKEALVGLLTLWGFQSSPLLAETLPLNMDLSSAERVTTAHTDAVIQIGDQAHQITAGSALTAGEAIALHQIVSGQTQSVTLDTTGSVVGGHFELNASFVNVASLSIPTNVTALYNVGSLAQLDLAGNLSNAGTIYAFGQNQSGIAQISALNIINHSTGTISTALPTSLAAIYGPSNLNLSLSAANEIINAGTITSAGALSMIAGNQIVNTGVMQAVSNIDIASIAGNIINNASIVSQAGSLNLSSTLANNLIVSNVSGILDAQQGNVTLFGLTEQLNTSLIGGSVLAEALNLNAPGGLAIVELENLTGELNIAGGEAHVSVSTPELALGNICLTGDPTFFNSGGDIIINTNLMFPGAPLAIIASGDIKTASGAGIISTSSATGGAPITIVAGARFTSTSVSGNPFDPVTLTISGASASGGSINLDNGFPITTLDSRALSGNASGGDITLVAFSSVTNPTSGRITLPAALTVKSGGSGSGANGNIAIIAPSNISLGSLQSTGGTGSGGTTRVLVAEPLTSSSVVVDNAVISSGLFTGQNLNAADTMDFGIISALPLSGGRIGIQSIVATNTVIASAGAVNIDSIEALGSAGMLVNSTPLYIGAGPAGQNNVASISTGANTYLRSSLRIAPNAIGATGTIFLNSNDLEFSGGNYTGSYVVQGFGLRTAGHSHLHGELFDFSGAFSATNVGFGSGQFSFQTDTPDALIKLYAAHGGGGAPIDLAAFDTDGTIQLTQNGNFVGTGTLDLSGTGSNPGGKLLISGGQVNLSSATILARGGPLGGAGGSVIIDSSSVGPLVIGTVDVSAPMGDGGIFRVSGTNVDVGDVRFSAGMGNGGTFRAYATNLTMNSGLYDADGRGGNFNGGLIDIYYNTSLTLRGTDPLEFSADGSGSGNGGRLELQTRSLDFSQFSFSASGGSPGSLAGNGGFVRFYFVSNEVIDPSNWNIHPLGINGNGATISFFYPSNVLFSDSIIVDGKGTGNGGRVEIFDSFTPITVGYGTASNGVDGIISAQSTSGAGGSVSLRSSNGVTFVGTNAVMVGGATSGGRYELGGTNLNLSSDYLGAEQIRIWADSVSTPSGFLHLSTAGQGPNQFIEFNSWGSAPLNLSPATHEFESPNVLVTNYSGAITISDMSIFSTPLDTLRFQSQSILITDDVVAGSLSIHTIGGAPFVVGSSAGSNGVTGTISVENNTGPEANLRIMSGNTIVFENSNDVQVTATAPGSKASVELLPNVGGVLFGPGTLSVVGADEGRITIQAGGVYGDQTVLHADGGQSGGYIDISTYGAPLYLGTGPGELRLESGSGTAAGIRVVNYSGDLISTQGGIAILGPAGNQSQIHLETSGGAFQILDDLTMPGPGRVVLIFDQAFSSDFVVGGPVITNGVQGDITAIGGNIQIGAYNISGVSNFDIQGTIRTDQSGVTGTTSFGSGDYVPYGFDDLRINIAPSAALLSTVSTTSNQLTIQSQSAAPLTIGDVTMWSSNPLLVDAPNSAISFIGRTATPSDLSVTGSTINVSGNLTAENNTSFTASSVTFTNQGRLITGGSLQMQTNLLQNAGYLASIGTMSLMTPTIENNGAIATPSQLSVTNPNGVTITGTGSMAGNPLFFEATNGTVNVNQGNLIGTVTGSGANGFNVREGQALTTFDLISLGLQTSTLTAEQRALLLTNLPNVITVSNTVLSTDTRPLHISLSKNDGVDLSVPPPLFRGVVLTQSQVFCMTGDCTEFGEEGTEVSEEDHVTILGKGSIVVDAGEGGKDIETELASIKVEPNSTVLVDARPGKGVRVITLAGKNGATVNSKNGTGKGHAVKPGFEVLLASKDLADEELIPVDCATGPVECVLGSKKTVRRQVKLKDLSVNNVLIGGALVRLGGAPPARHKRVTARIIHAANEQSPFHPVAQVAPVGGGSTLGATKPTTPGLRGSAAAGSNYRHTGENSIALASGKLILYPGKPLTVTTGLAKVVIPAGEIAEIVAEPGVIRIRGCSGLNSAEVYLGKNYKVDLAAGKELIISDKKRPAHSFSDDGIGRRRTLTTTPDGKLWVTSSDFSIVSLLARQPYLWQVVHAATSEHKQMQEKMLKTFTAQQMTFKNRGPFESSH